MSSRDYNSVASVLEKAGEGFSEGVPALEDIRLGQFLVNALRFSGRGADSLFYLENEAFLEVLEDYLNYLKKVN